MKITIEKTAQKISDYLQNRIGLDKLVAWAEDAMQKGEFAEEDSEIVREVIGRIGVADVRAFGITWEDCEYFLSRLGYQVKVLISEAPSLQVARHF